MRVVLHTVVSGLLAQAQGGSAIGGAAGGLVSSVGVEPLSQLFFDKSADQLTQEQKEMIANLATLAGMGAGAAVGGSTGAGSGGVAAKVEVENNWLSTQEADRKAVLERKEKAGSITSEEMQELVSIKQDDKARDEAIRSVCTDGNKAGSACSALIGPAQVALEKYGEKATYSLIYKDLYPKDAKNLENILQGLDSGSIDRDQAITAIASASGKSRSEVAKQYDLAMQLQALTSTLAGYYGTNWINTATKKSGLIDGAGDSSTAKIRIDYKPEGAYINQTSHSSGGGNLCGPTSCAMVISDSKGIVVNLDSVVKQFDDIRPSGVNVYEMGTVLSSNGVANKPTTTLMPNQLRELGLQGQSTIIGVDAGKGSHFLIVDSYKEVNGIGYYLIRDPFNGATGVRSDVLEKAMNYNGVIFK